MLRKVDRKKIWNRFDSFERKKKWKSNKVERKMKRKKKVKNRFNFLGRQTWSMSRVMTNVFRTGLVIEPEKLPVHGSPVRPAVEPLSNR